MAIIISVNLILLVFVFLLLKKSTRVDSATLKHTGLLELAWVGFQTLLWLFILFDILEGWPEGESFVQAAGKEMVILLSTIAGFVIAHVGLSFHIAFKIFRSPHLIKE